ncbi:MarR family transcriptional regulator, partial [Streptomyces sp. SID2955]|nr:MarR family transcriptional regulator [Streptomyces sp. SID2955]
MEADTFPEDLADALVGVQRLIRRRLRGGISGPRLRGAEVELLRLVESRPGIGISDAARRLHLAGNSVSTLVNQLARDGYLARETDP